MRPTRLLERAAAPPLSSNPVGRRLLLSHDAESDKEEKRMGFFRRLFRAEPAHSDEVGPGQVLRCDRCAGSVPYETGYAFYCTSSISVGGEVSQLRELGNMLVCDACTDVFMTERYWSERVAELRKGELGHMIVSPSSDDLRKQHDLGIIALCFGLELSPMKARSKARKLSLLYWRAQDKEEAEREIFNAWNEKRPRPTA